MPTYDYKCTACKHAMEAFHSMKDKPLRKCPSCGKNALERQIGTGAAVLFKGSGFYQTDYRSESYKKSASADTAPSAAPKSDAPKSDAPASTAAPAATTAPAKSDAKPATKKSPAKDN